MATRLNRALVPAAWLFYLVIVFEIVYMTSPVAVYYYGAYGPTLNFLRHSELTAWLTQFFLPHFAVTSSAILNHLAPLGWFLLVVGFVIFAVSAWQIYSAKLTRKGAVTGGLYALIRHPQYCGFSIMGLGTLLLWPRFLVLVMYITMLFSYFLLACAEEGSCEKQFGERYLQYKQRTSMFLPTQLFRSDRMRLLPRSGWKRGLTILALYAVTIALSVATAFLLRDFALSRLPTWSSADMAAIATAPLSREEIGQALNLAMAHPEVRSRLEHAGYGSGQKFLAYLVPLDWFFVDLPLEAETRGHGHYHPPNFNREDHKILFAKANGVSPRALVGQEILRRTVGMTPVVVVRIGRSGKVLAVEEPPAHVRWGDIPMPLF
jgi:protein-S-isoprenylcysteine O-methyltransferase Ste14